MIKLYAEDDDVVITEVKPLNLADTYSSDYEDDEPTVKIQVPEFRNQVVVSEEGNKYPGIGLALALIIGTAMWFLPCYYFAMWVIFR